MHPPDPNPSLNPPSSWINLLSQDKWTTHRLPLAFVFDCCVCIRACAAYNPHAYCRLLSMERMCPPSSDVPLVRVATTFALMLTSIASTQTLIHCLNISEREGNGFGWVSLVGWADRQGLRAGLSMLTTTTVSLIRWKTHLPMGQPVDISPPHTAGPFSLFSLQVVLAVGSRCGYRDRAAEASIGCSSCRATLVYVPFC